MKRISFLIVGLIVIAAVVMAAETNMQSTKVIEGLKSQIGRAGNFILTRYEEATAPATPAASLGIIYFKADGKVYSKSATDGESDLTAGAGGGAPDQNLYETFIGDSGTTTANTINDTLDIEGGTNITTVVTDDKVTVNLDQLDLDDINEGTTAYFTYNNFNGMFKEPFDADVTSNGTTITMSIEKTGTGDLTTLFSSGVLAYDTTPADTIALTAGSDASPQKNYIYILQTAPTTLVKSTSSWPAGEHIKIGFFFCQSASSTQTAGGALINQNWNDFIFDGNNQGHLSHVTERMRMSGTVYFDGVDGNGGTTSYYTLGVGNTEFICTSGFVFQLHKQTFPAFNTSSGDTIHVVNWNGESFRALTELFDITADSTGATIGNNKFFNLIIWGVINKSGEHQAVMINLPNGFYNSQSEAENDVSGFDVFSIPREFSIDSTTGFLIARTTFQMKATWVHASTVDLRGTTPQTASGGAGGIVQDFPDNAFTVFDNSDNTKVLVFDVGANVTTGNTRTLSAPDADGTIALTSQSDGTIVAASTSVSGIVELATAAETTSGTVVADRAVTPDGLASSDYGKRYLGFGVVESDTAITVVNGTLGIPITSELNGYNIIDVQANVYTKGVTGTTDIQIRRQRGGVDTDVLSTKITIGDEYFASDEVIDTGNDDLATGDMLFIDRDAIHSGTAPNGLSVVIIAQLP